MAWNCWTWLDMKLPYNRFEDLGRMDFGNWGMWRFPIGSGTTVMSKTVFFNQDQDFWKVSLDIETVIHIFRIPVLLLKPVSTLCRLQSWYRDWYQDFEDCSVHVETGIKTFRIAVLILRLVSRLSGLQSKYQDWYYDFFLLTFSLICVLRLSKLFF